MTKRLLPVLIGLLFVGACGDKKSSSGGAKSSKVASCKASFSCTEYENTDQMGGEDGLRKLCENPAIGGTFAMAACPTDKLVGSCTNEFKVELYYAESGMSAADIEKMCPGQFKKP
jgi:hypothetical protein